METVVPNRMNSHELTFNIGHLAFERSGLYEFRLFANDRFVGGANLTVIESGQESNNG